MNALAPWQRTFYFLGEAVMVGGLLWAVYHKIFVGGCPYGPFNFLTLVVIGLALSTLPLHPFGERRYFTPVLRNNPAVAIVLWALALAGIACALYLLAQGLAVARYWWALATIPAFLYFWFAIPSKLTDNPVTPGRAPKPPAKTANETIVENNPEKEGQVTDA